VTYIIRSDKPVRSSQPFWTFLKSKGSDKLLNSIKTIKMFADQKGVAFDIPLDL
jgi:hypothetical protein